MVLECAVFVLTYGVMLVYGSTSAFLTVTNTDGTTENIVP